MLSSPVLSKKEERETMITVKIGEREIPMMLSTYEMIAIQAEVGCTVPQMREEVFGVTENEETGELHFGIAEDPAKMKKLGILLKILGNAGLEESGETPDLTDKWMLRHMKPGMILVYAIAAWGVICEGMMMENKEEKQTGPVDVTIEEINRKKEPGN